MESYEKNGINRFERYHRKDDPLTVADIQSILIMIPQGIDADEFVYRLCNEAVFYAKQFGKLDDC